MTYALDAAFTRAIERRRGEGHRPRRGRASTSRPGTTSARPSATSTSRSRAWRRRGGSTRTRPAPRTIFVREQELYLGMCRRWRELPKPTIAMVQGACIAGGLMLAWVCDLIVAADDAFFADPVVKMGIPGVEYFAHPLRDEPAPVAKEFLFLGERMTADARATQIGMVNRVVPRDALERRDARARDAHRRRCRASGWRSRRRRSTRPRTAWACATRWTRPSRCTTSRTPTTR